MEEKELEMEQRGKVAVTINDVLMILLSGLYIWEWLQIKDLSISRVIAVAVLAIWWTLFVLKLVRR
ncbi:MAG: hypothetical protein JWM44_3555 [Bacilli bacterium]|jgi:hypothetical protein|nr:hypothetical protein [Bacilli bacterium]